MTKTSKDIVEEVVREFRPQFDELGMKPPKGSMPGLERELIVDFWSKALTRAMKAACEAVVVDEKTRDKFFTTEGFRMWNESRTQNIANIKRFFGEE